MTPHRAIVLALIVGIIGVFVGYALSRNASKAGATVPATSMPPVTAPTSYGYKADADELFSTKMQLAICMAYRTQAPEGARSRAPDGSEPEPLKPRIDPLLTSFTHAINENRKLLDSYREAVIVFHPDGKLGVYKPNEWPSDGDGQIIARKFSDGHIGWYAGPEAGPRSDPAAFQPLAPSDIVPPVVVYQPDGTITVNGAEGNTAVQKMFGGKVRDAGP